MERWQTFLPLAVRYGADRNFVRAEHANVSGLSPYLQRRLVLEEEVSQAAIALHGFAGVEKFVQEVWWRTYWKGWLEGRPAVWTRWVEAVPRRLDALKGERAAAYAAAVAGRTDIACFNAWSRELVETGWLHNHARMWFASIWIFTLRLPWELGAAFFLRHLLDGDAASNTLSWRWVAGLQTRGKSYLARADNIARFTEGAHEPAPGQLAEAGFVIEEEGGPVPWVEPEPSEVEGQGELTGRTGWWLHGEDLAWEVGGAAAKGGVVSGFAKWPEGLGAHVPGGWCEGVEQFNQAALVDGARRAAGRAGVDFATGGARDWVEAMVGWARAERLETVAAWRPFVGPWEEVGRAAEAALGRVGVRVLWIRRTRDARWFPAATRGYFPFWAAVRAEERAG